jgi:uncharacterized protein YjiS (DUF1127 family)
MTTTLDALWRAWWDYQVRRAADAMLRLDAGALADIGIHRRDLTSLLDNKPALRQRRRG